MGLIKPYVGISCITSLHEAQQVADLFLKYQFSRANQIQGSIGYAITWEILHGGKPGKRYLSVYQLKDTMLHNKDFGINVLHFVPKPNSEEQFYEEILTLFDKTGLYKNNICRTLQLNFGTSVPSFALHKVKEQFPDLKIIFQIGRENFNSSESDTLLQNLSDYVSYIDMFLCDPSQGTGQLINLNQISNFILKLKEHFPQISLGFAGGLSPQNLQNAVQKIDSLVLQPFAIDVESAVRTTNDALDINKVEHFLQTAFSCFYGKIKANKEKNHGIKFINKCRQ